MLNCIFNLGCWMAIPLCIITTMDSEYGLLQIHLDAAAHGFHGFAF